VMWILPSSSAIVREDSFEPVQPWDSSPLLEGLGSFATDPWYEVVPEPIK
jgi:hypothetical protein